MHLHDLKPAEGSTHRRKVVGRGPGSGHGKTSTRGHNGNKARGQVNPNFEGGQTPLHRRLPQVRGFKPVNKIYFAVINVGVLDELFEAGTVVTPEALLQQGVIRNLHEPIKVLGDGEIGKPLTVQAHRFSQSAREKLTTAGGTVEEL